MQKINERWQGLITTRKALKEKDAAIYISMSRPYLRRARMEGTTGGQTPGPEFIKKGRSVLYMVSDLDAWLEEGRQA